MYYILQIETSTSMCSCALSLNGKTIQVKEINQPNIHIEKLTLFIKEAIEEAGLIFSDLNAIAVSMGPGSYTGLRIGVSVAKGLCYGLDIPLIAVYTLEAMARGFMENEKESLSNAWLCPMIDARRREVYSAIYNSSFELQAPIAARIIDESSFDFLKTQSQEIILFGDGAEKFADTFKGNSQIRVYRGFVNSASYMSAIAYAHAKENKFEDLAYFEPFYLKDFIPTVSKKQAL